MLRSVSVLGFAAGALAACNGHDELCSRKYSEITHLGAHDSAFVGVIPTNDQYVSVGDQLGLGVRFLEAQTHDLDGTIEMCHTTCSERDAGSLTDYLKSIADFMNGNHDEVVTVLLTNGDGISLDKFDAVFDAVGLKSMVFIPPSNGTLGKSDWPTLQEMIDAGSRLVVLMDAHADTSQVNYILPEFDHFWETTYGVTDSSFPDCNVDRPSGGDPNVLMGIMNHMLNYDVAGVVFPDQDSVFDTNSQDSINAEVDNCKKTHDNIQPNVILLDWVNLGDGPAAVNALNGLT